SSFTVLSATEIDATSPPHGPSTVNVRVTTPAGESAANSGDHFTYLPEVTIEFGRCKKVTTGTGKYKNGNCTEAVAGSNYEWTPGLLKGGFTAASLVKTTITIEAVGGAKMVCNAESATGEYTGTKQVSNVVIKLTGCEYPSSKAKCATAGAAEGEVVTNTLEGVLDWVKKETNKVGLDLSPVAESGVFFEATCGATTVSVEGSVITTINPLDNMSSAFTLKYKQKKGKQERTNFEKEEADVLKMSVSGGAFEEAGLGLESETTNEEELEISTII
ncbi:MAG TPA: hypothetical protein VES97_11185, partial [Solirubrobacteraceae bacterium]|nr:hypothetical protein [Solirubrobacteraceae bacterium]